MVVEDKRPVQGTSEFRQVGTVERRSTVMLQWLAHPTIQLGEDEMMPVKVDLSRAGHGAEVERAESVRFLKSTPAYSFGEDTGATSTCAHPDGLELRVRPEHVTDQTHAWHYEMDGITPTQAGTSSHSAGPEWKFRLGVGGSRADDPSLLRTPQNRGVRRFVLRGRSSLGI